VLLAELRLVWYKSLMSVEITYFVHGTTFDNEQNISSGWKDVDISPNGVEQSIALKDQIKDNKFDIVVLF